MATKRMVEAGSRTARVSGTMRWTLWVGVVLLAGVAQSVRAQAQGADGAPATGQHPAQAHAHAHPHGQGHAHGHDHGHARHPAHAEPVSPEGIGEVLDRSQRQRMALLRGLPASPESVEVIRASFLAVMAAWPQAPQVSLLVTRAPVIAESLIGRVIVASEALAGLPEGQRRFVLAHELGHVIEGHWARMGLLYRKHVPGVVDAAHTDAVAHVLGREASHLAHEQELAADAFGLRLIEAMGHGVDDAMGAFRCFGVLPDTATHPGTRKRVAHLRMLKVDQAAAP